MKEKDIEEIWNKINKEKTASPVDDVTDLISELEKTASDIEDNDEDNPIRKMIKDNHNDIDRQAIKGDLKVESSNLAKQRLKEIAFEGLKNGEPDRKYQKLRSLLIKESEVNEDDLVEKLSDELVEKIRRGEF